MLNRGRIEIGNDVVLDSRFGRVELVSAPGGRIVIGSGSWIEHGSLLVASTLVELGDEVVIGAYCVLCDSDAPDAMSGVSCPGAARIWIGDAVVLGPRVAVMPGTAIGAGSHVVAGSLVANDVPPGVVAGGNPARPLDRVRVHRPAYPPFVPGEAAVEMVRAGVQR